MDLDGLRSHLERIDGKKKNKITQMGSRLIQTYLSKIGVLYSDYGLQCPVIYSNVISHILQFEWIPVYSNSNGNSIRTDVLYTHDIKQTTQIVTVSLSSSSWNIAQKNAKRS